MLEATFDSPGKSARIPAAELERTTESKGEPFPTAQNSLTASKVNATRVLNIQDLSKTPSESRPTPGGIQTINVMLSESRENNKVALHVEQPSNRLFKSSYDARNYYKRFQKVVDNMAKMRRSLLLSPA